MEFKHQQWKDEIYEALSSYGQLHDPIVVGKVLENGYSQSNYVNDAVLGMRYRLTGEGREVTKEVEEEYRKNIVQEYKDSVNSALSTYQRQLVVLFSTYVEVIAQNLVESIFHTSPEKMHDYVSNEKGKVSFTDLLKYGSKKEYLNQLAKRSVSNVIVGEWKQILKRIEGLAGDEIDNKELIIKLMSLRNRIVHENSKEEVGDDGVYDSYEVVKGFVEYCKGVG